MSERSAIDDYEAAELTLDQVMEKLRTISASPDCGSSCDSLEEEEFECDAAPQYIPLCIPTAVVDLVMQIVDSVDQLENINKEEKSEIESDNGSICVESDDVRILIGDILDDLMELELIEAEKGGTEEISDGDASWTDESTKDEEKKEVIKDEKRRVPKPLSSTDIGGQWQYRPQITETQMDYLSAYLPQTPLIYKQFLYKCLEPFNQFYQPDWFPEKYPSKPNWQQLAQAALEPLGPVPLLPIYNEAYIQFRCDPQLFYLMPCCWDEVYVQLEQSLNKTYEIENVPPLNTGALSYGQPVCAKSETQETWYRCMLMTEKPVILKEEGQIKVLVFYVDWGNSEWLSLDRVKPLLKKFGDLPPLAFRCRTYEDAYTADEPMTDKQVDVWNGMLDDEAMNKVLVKWFTLDQTMDNVLWYTVEMAFTYPNKARDYPGPGKFILDRTSRVRQLSSFSEDQIENKIKEFNSKEFWVDMVAALNASRVGTIQTRGHKWILEDSSGDETPHSGKCKRDMTDQEYRDFIVCEWQDEEKQWRQNRRRQRTGPSGKVMRAEMENAKLQAMGNLGRIKRLDWQLKEGRPWTRPREADFSRDRPPPYCFSFSEQPMRPREMKSIEAFVTNVDSGKKVEVQTAQQMELSKEVMELLSVHFTDDSQPMPDEFIRSGFACIARDPQKANHFCRAQIAKFIPKTSISLVNVDTGYTLADIAWTDRHQIKVLPEKGLPVDIYCRPKQCFTLKVRQLCEPKHTIWREWTPILRDVLEEGHCVLIINDGVFSKAPFRCTIGYRKYPDSYIQRDYYEYKEKFDDLVEQRTGRRPKYTEHKWAPPRRLRKKVREQVAWARDVEESEERRDMTRVPPPDILPVPMNASKYAVVMVTAIASPKRLYIQTEEMYRAAEKIYADMTAHYKVNIQEQLHSNRIRFFKDCDIFLNKPCAVVYSDQTYQRASVVDMKGARQSFQDISDGFYKPTQIKVHYTDFGDDSDWMAADKCLYPLISRFRRVPQQCIECCLYGFKQLHFTNREHQFLVDLLHEWLDSTQNEGRDQATWYGHFWKEAPDDNQYQLKLYSGEGDVINEMVLDELRLFREASQ